jgi:hypothetical protein
LCKSNSNWCWLVSDKVLEVSSGDVAIEKSGDIVGISFAFIKEEKRLGDWCVSISDKVTRASLVMFSPLSLPTSWDDFGLF